YQAFIETVDLIIVCAAATKLYIDGLIIPLLDTIIAAIVFSR
ncbi:hypothetical protein TNCT_556641, partial [Trichonephila clavata]